MNLFDKTEKTIDVYPMLPNMERLSQFKEKEMKRSITPKDRIIRVKTNDELLLADTSKPIPLKALQHTESGLWGGSYYHYFESYEMTNEEKIRQLELLKQYYMGLFSKKPIALIEDYAYPRKTFKIIGYLLLTKPYTKDTLSFDTYTMDDVISIPRSLYLLQLLENGQFAKVEKEDIKEQLLAFDIPKEPIKRHSIDELKSMYDSSLLPGAFEMVMKNVETTSKILQKIR